MKTSSAFILLPSAFTFWGKRERKAGDASERESAEGKLGVSEARRGLGDVVRLAGRARRLERRLGKRGAASLSPYLQSLLRLATESNIVAPAQVRRAVGF